MPARVVALPVRRGSFLNESHRARMNSRVQVRKPPSLFSIVAPFIFLVTIVVPAFSVWSGLTQKATGVDRLSPAVSVQTVVAEDSPWQALWEPVFTPGVQLDSVQMEGYEMVTTLPNNPAKYGLDNLGLPALGLTTAQSGALAALAMSESEFHHLDESGGVLTSEAGCVGRLQGCNQMCLWEYWLAPNTNVWCGAFTFRYYWDQYGVDANPFMLHYAYAAYKGAFAMKDVDGDGKKDTVVYDQSTGLPVIDSDLEDQVRLAESYLVWVRK